jgi:hypothetical protein
MLAYVWNNFKTGNAGPSSNWEFYRYSNASQQDYVAGQYGQRDRDRDIPLPGTLALFGIGLAGLGLARRKS